MSKPNTKFELGKMLAVFINAQMPGSPTTGRSDAFEIFALRKIKGTRGMTPSRSYAKYG